ncbi:MAG TPA: hypothetical protein VFU05_19465 [Cyclobacteriaceae bacterium]|nr:hypothetical protein [Cyclobacteriaceae bacterium]
MKSRINFFTVPILLTLFRCATIVGGSNYTADVIVKDHPSAVITYKDQVKGSGVAFFKAKRSEANKFSVTVKEDGCKEQTINFTTRSFRGGAFVGTVIGWTGLISGIPIPWGVALDLATGALWKPNEKEPGIMKVDYKHYVYTINYTGCSARDSIANALPIK